MLVQRGAVTTSNSASEVAAAAASGHRRLQSWRQRSVHTARSSRGNAVRVRHAGSSDCDVRQSQMKRWWWCLSRSYTR